MHQPIHSQGSTQRANSHILPPFFLSLWLTFFWVKLTNMYLFPFSALECSIVWLSLQCIQSLFLFTSPPPTIPSSSRVPRPLKGAALKHVCMQFIDPFFRKNPSTPDGSISAEGATADPEQELQREGPTHATNKYVFRTEWMQEWPWQRYKIITNKKNKALCVLYTLWLEQETQNLQQCVQTLNTKL